MFLHKFHLNLAPNWNDGIEMRWDKMIIYHVGMHYVIFETLSSLYIDPIFCNLISIDNVKIHSHNFELNLGSLMNSQTILSSHTEYDIHANL